MNEVKFIWRDHSKVGETERNKDCEIYFPESERSYTLIQSIIEQLRNDNGQ